MRRLFHYPAHGVWAALLIAVASCGGDGSYEMPTRHFKSVPASTGPVTSCVSWKLKNRERFVIEGLHLTTGNAWVSSRWYVLEEASGPSKDKSSANAKDTTKPSESGTKEKPPSPDEIKRKRQKAAKQNITVGPEGPWKCAERGLDLELSTALASVVEQSGAATADTMIPTSERLPLVVPKNAVIVGEIEASAPTSVTVAVHTDDVGQRHHGTYWMPDQSSNMAGSVDWLFYGILGLCVFCFIGITVATIYFTWKYRARPGHKAQPSASHNDQLEITWTVIPSIIVVIIFVLGWRGYIELATPPRHAEEIRVEGQKWTWLFKYKYKGTELQDDVLHVPVDRKVRLVMSSRDVIHSFFVPAFRVKQDVVPGRYTKLWFTATRPGVYRVFCAEYCGKEHSLMKTRVIVHETGGYEEYLQKLREEQENMDPIDLGKDTYTKLCVGCHTVDGRPHTGPTLKGLFGKKEKTNKGEVEVDENYLRESILDPNAKIVTGYAAQMPTFQGTLSEKRINGLIEFIKSLSQ